MADLARQLERSRLPTRLAYLGLLLLATLSSMRLDLSLGSVAGLRRMLHPSFSPRDVIDGARNVALFAGWGLVWMVTAPAGRSAVALRNAVLSGALISTFVEVAQLFSPTRTASVLDVVSNTLGALVGALGLVALVVLAARRRGGRSFVGIPALAFAASYGISCAGEAFTPLFRQELRPNVWGGPLGRFRVVWSMFEWSSLTRIPFTDVLLFAPAGAFAVAALAETGWSYRRSAGAVALGGAGLAVLVEFLHGFLGLPLELGAVVAHAGGVAAGGALAAWGLPRATRRLRGSQRPVWLLAIYAPVLLLWALRPYTPETSWAAVVGKLTDKWWIPLRFLGARVDMFSVVDVVSPFFLYLPLGALLAVWPLRRRGFLGLFWPGVYLAAATELSQVLVAGRLLDSTDLLVQAAGVVVGWAVARRAGFHPYGSVLAERSG